MNAPPPGPPSLDPETAKRLLDVAEWSTKLGVAGVTLWGIVRGILRPFIQWRTLHRARALEAQKGAFRTIVRDEMRTLYEEHDDLLTVALDNRDRQDETNVLLDEIGLVSDRRRVIEDPEITVMIHELSERRKLRRRGQE